MATLLSRVRAVTGSTTTQTSDANVVTFIQSGVQYVIAGIPKELQWNFATAGSNITSSTGQRPASDTVLSVTRNSIECKEIPMSLAYAQESSYSSTSLYAGTALFPVYYKKGGLVYIKPDPTVSAVGSITSVAIPTITSTTADTASTWYYRVVDQIIINYAIALDFIGTGSYWRKKAETLIDSVDSPGLSYTNVEDALTKAQVLIDNNSDIDFETYMGTSEEDDQQAGLTIQAASQEVNRATQELSKLRTKLEEAGSDVNATIQYLNAAQQSYANASKHFEMAAIELKQYISNNSRMIKATGGTA